MVFRIEAAAYKGKPISFEIVGPWSRSARSAPIAPSVFDRIVDGISSLVMPGLIVVAVVLARKNIKARPRRPTRRASRRGDCRLSPVWSSWLLGAAHFADVNREVARVFARTGDALFQAGADVADLSRPGALHPAILTRQSDRLDATHFRTMARSGCRTRHPDWRLGGSGDDRRSTPFTTSSRRSSAGPSRCRFSFDPTSPHGYPIRAVEHHANGSSAAHHQLDAWPSWASSRC